MRNLSPCTACKRHIRVSETACPFCGEANAGRGASAETEGARRGRPGGRAALFLAGVTAIAGCEDDSGGSGTTGSTAGTTSTTGTTATATGGTGGATGTSTTGSTGASGGATSGTSAGTSGNNIGAVPVYGVPIDGDAAVPSDAGTDAGDADIAISPVYGIPVDIDGGEQPMPLPVYGVAIDDKQ